MPTDLFAGIPVSDYAVALEWYERLFGSPPAFLPNEIEAVWELAEHRFVFIEQRPERAGHARHLAFVDDLDALVAQIAERGLEPTERETYANGVSKVAYRDPDGNEFGYGGTPEAETRRIGLEALDRLAELTADLPPTDAVKIVRESREELEKRAAL